MIDNARRLQIIRNIRTKARLASQTSRHDPEPQTPDVAQTVGLGASRGYVVYGSR